MNGHDLDNRLDRALKELPVPRAPRTLLPRVMAAVERPAARPAATGWLTWRPEWRAASVLLVLGAGLAFLFMSPPAPVAGFTHEAGKAVAVMRVLGNGVMEPLGAFVFVIGLVLALVAAAAWAGLEAALGGASRQ